MARFPAAGLPLSSANRGVPAKAFCRVASRMMVFPERMVLPVSPARVPRLRSGPPVRAKLAEADPTRTRAPLPAVS